MNTKIRFKLNEGLKVGEKITLIQTQDKKIITGFYDGCFDGLIRIKVWDEINEGFYTYFVNITCTRAIKLWDLNKK